MSRKASANKKNPQNQTFNHTIFSTQPNNNPTKHHQRKQQISRRGLVNPRPGVRHVQIMDADATPPSRRPRNQPAHLPGLPQLRLPKLITPARKHTKNQINAKSKPRRPDRIKPRFEERYPLELVDEVVAGAGGEALAPHLDHHVIQDAGVDRTHARSRRRHIRRRGWCRRRVRVFQRRRSRRLG